MKDGGNGWAESDIDAMDDKVVDKGEDVPPGGTTIYSGADLVLQSNKSGDDKREAIVNMYDLPTLNNPYGPLYKYDQKTPPGEEPTEARQVDLDRGEEYSTAPLGDGYCDGIAVASILLKQPVGVAGSNLTTDEMEGLWGRKACDQTYEAIAFMGNCPEDPDDIALPRKERGDPTDEFAGQFHKGLQIGFIDGLKVETRALLANLRGQKPRDFFGIWNHAIYEFSAVYEEVAATDTPRLFRVRCSVLENSIRKPPTDDEKPRTITYTYELPYGHDGRIDMGNKSKHNWISVDGEGWFAPEYLVYVVKSSWDDKENTELTLKKIAWLDAQNSEKYATREPEFKEPQ